MLYIIPPLRKGRLGGDCDTPNSPSPSTSPFPRGSARLTFGITNPTERYATKKGDNF